MNGHPPVPVEDGADHIGLSSIFRGDDIAPAEWATFYPEGGYIRIVAGQILSFKNLSTRKRKLEYSRCSRVSRDSHGSCYVTSHDINTQGFVINAVPWQESIAKLP